jgi:hypothetical protein
MLSLNPTPLERFKSNVLVVRSSLLASPWALPGVRVNNGFAGRTIKLHEICAGSGLSPLASRGAQIVENRRILGRLGPFQALDIATLYSLVLALVGEIRLSRPAAWSARM